MWCCKSKSTVAIVLTCPHTLVKSPSTSPIALFSSFSACLALSRALSATATAPLQFRPPQWRFPSSSRQPAPPQGLSAQGASPGAPQTYWDRWTCTCICMEIIRCVCRTETRQPKRNNYTFCQYWVTPECDFPSSVYHLNTYYPI